MAESLAEVRAAFDAWRTKSSGKSLVYPQSLRERALALPWADSDAELSAALGLSHVKVLRNWRELAKQGSKGGESALQTVGSFVEVGTALGLERPFGMGDDKPVLEVALEAMDGRCLRIRGALDSATVMGLARVALGTGGHEPCSS